MKFTLSWLKDHLDTTATLDAIATALTALGLEVESVTDRAGALAPFTVAQIIDAQPHPSADRLRVCRVQTGTQELGIVCGAPNARAGIKVVLAQAGAVIPSSGMIIKKSAIRGVESNGMLCSARELALGTDGDGIMELAADAPLGAPIAPLLGLDDPVIDIAITPNRGDCLGVRGVARDLAAAGIGTLKPLPAMAEPGTAPCPVTVKLDAGEDCPLFVGCAVSGLTNPQSPDWLKQRLEAVGLRPISALVDITNYLTIDLGRPLHVYDRAALKGNITVRHAQEGETLQALNGKDYALDAGMVAIADDAGVLGLGGVIGGTPSGCTDTTTDIFLEAAWFNPVAIAQAGRALGVDSDARYRFERHVDPAFTETGARIALSMILSLCGGTPSALSVAGSVPGSQRSITFDPARVASLGGMELPSERTGAILQSLGFAVERTGSAPWRVTPPSWRADIDGEADLVEEALRVASYDHIPAVTLPPCAKHRSALSLPQRRSALARRLLAARGMMELCNWSFTSEVLARRFGHRDAPILLKNPIHPDLSSLRPSLLPGLLVAAQRNHDRSIHRQALFEVGNCYDAPAPGAQHVAAAGIRLGDVTAASAFGAPRACDLFDAKADAIALLTELGVKPAQIQVTRDAPSWYHPGRSGALTLGGKILLAHFGELHPQLLQEMGITQRVVAFEALPDAIPQPRAKTGKAKPVYAASDYPAVERDFAFLAQERVAAADILRAIEGADKELITSSLLFDVYTGPGVAAGSKSLAIRVTLQAKDRTLTEAEIEAACGKVIDSVKKLGVTLRG